MIGGSEMFCVKCGTEINSEDLHCSKCGAVNENYIPQKGTKKIPSFNGVRRENTEVNEEVCR